jgi:anaerobic ribonucleoside-triphosphate reductase
MVGWVEYGKGELVGKVKVEEEVPCEVYSRIVGYIRPVQNWNVAKRQEWKDRRPYEQPVLT